MSETVPEEIRNKGIELLSVLVPGWLDTEVVEQWVEIRSQTPDGNPIVGWTELEGLSLAAFHTSGIQLAPVTGKSLRLSFWMMIQLRIMMHSLFPF